MNNLLLYIGSAVIFIWGLSHIIPTNAILKSFGSIPKDQKHIITMEWIAEGLILIFIAGLVFSVTLITTGDNPVSIMVVRICSIMLIVMAGLTLFTGARTTIIPIKICPFVKTIVAVLFLISTLYY